jgi:7-cyano-7-deazaguanine synthase
MKSIVLLSGGLDSCVLAAYAKTQSEVLALSFDYGQRHKCELKAATAIASLLDIPHLIMPLAISGSSALIDKNTPLPQGRSPEEIASQGIPSTYVHARNMLFLAHATSLAESKGAATIYFGANRYDFDCYPDCRPAFFQAFNDLLKVWQKRDHSRGAASEGPLRTFF